MRITKLGHCCMVIETDGVKIVTDPGSFTTAQNDIEGVSAILITHEHQDHLHIDSLKAMAAKNPTCLIIGNSAVAKLVRENIPGAQVVTVGDGQETLVGTVRVSGHGKDHALVYPPNVGLVENTGYFVGEKFYFPGDSFHNPGIQVDLLALPVAGPWMKIADAVDFAKEIKARMAFGVHDGMVQPFFRGFVGNLLKNFVPETTYISLQDGETREL